MTPENTKEIQSLKEEVKKIKQTNKKKEDSLKDKIKKLQSKVRESTSYKKLIVASAQSSYDPQMVVDNLRFIANAIHSKNWKLVDRTVGISGHLMTRGICPVCDINLVGKEPKPRDWTLPCHIKKCPFGDT